MSFTRETISWRTGPETRNETLGWDVHTLGGAETAETKGVFVALVRGAATPSAICIAESVASLGIGALEQLLDDHCAFVIDGRVNKVHLSRDFMGTKPLCWARANGRLAVSSEPLAAQLLLNGAASEDRQTSGEYENQQRPPVDATFFDGVKSVPPDSIVTLAETTVVRRRRFVAKKMASDEAALSMVKSSIDNAVAARIRGPGAVACQASGGVDSGVIAASTATQVSTATFITHRVAGIEDDETGRASELARRHNVAHEIVNIQPTDLVDRVVADIRVHGPSHPTFWLSGATIESASDLGIKQLLTGHLGDEWLTMAGGPLAQSVWDNELSRVPAFALSRNREREESWTETLWAVGRLFASGIIKNRTYAHHVQTVFVADSWIQRTMMSLERAGALHGVRIETPFADRGYVQTVLGLTAWQRNRPNRPKRALRDAFAEVLPRSYVEDPMKANFYDAPSLAFDGDVSGAAAWSRIRQILLAEWRVDLAKIGSAL